MAAQSGLFQRGITPVSLGLTLSDRLLDGLEGELQLSRSAQAASSKARSAPSTTGGYRNPSC